MLADKYGGYVSLVLGLVAYAGRIRALVFAFSAISVENYGSTEDAKGYDQKRENKNRSGRYGHDL